jgi:hypothetical protein
MSDSLLEFLENEIAQHTDIPKKTELKEGQAGIKDLDFLSELIDKEVDNLIYLMEKGDKSAVKAKADGGEQVAFTIPKLYPNESWGDPKSSGRKEAYNFFQKFQGNTLSAKLKNINGIAERSTNIRSTAKILATLVFFDSLSSVVKDFTASAAGFVFEGFLAALLNGTQEIERSVGGTLDITDLRAVMSKDGKGGLKGGYPISLKLLTGGGADVKGSYANLVGTLAEGSDDSLLYVVVAKDKSEKADRLSFHEFDINPGNFYDILNQNANNMNLGVLHSDITKNKLFRKIMLGRGINPDELAAMSDGYLDKGNSYAIIMNELTPELVNNTKQFFELMRYTRGYYQKHGSGLRSGEKPEEETEKTDADLASSPLMENLRRGPLGLLLEEEGAGATQFHISQPQMLKLKSYRHVGELDVSPEKMKSIMEIYAEQLQGTLTDTYNNLRELTSNVNEYFLSERTARRNTYAEKAIKSAVKQSEHADAMKDEVAAGSSTDAE